MVCKGNKDETCGGSNAITVYTRDDADADEGEMEHLGCYRDDGTNRIMKMASTESGSMTPKVEKELEFFDDSVDSSMQIIGCHSKSRACQLIEIFVWIFKHQWRFALQSKSPVKLVLTFIARTLPLPAKCSHLQNCGEYCTKLNSSAKYSGVEFGKE